jgi:hypothetical protein
MQEDLLQEARDHFNEPILVGFDLCRCVGYAEDDEDCYLIVNVPRRGLVWHTFVGGYTYLTILKSQDKCGEWNDFTRLDSLLELNGIPKVKEMIILNETQRPGKEDSVRLDHAVQEGTRSVEDLHPGTDSGSTSIIIAPI